MLFYDIGQSAWVRQPGSSEPPWMVPVLTVGATHAISVTFADGEDVLNYGGSTWFLGIKSNLDFAGDYVASNSAPTEDGESAITFVLDLDTAAAKAYFTANPTEPTLSCEMQIVWTDDVKRVTAPLKIVLQNTYLKDQ